MKSDLPDYFFEPHAWQVRPWLSRAEYLLTAGRPGGGKSHMWVWKAHSLALEYPGMTAVLFRKKRKDMDQSIEPMLLEDVARVAEREDISWLGRQDRLVYHHDNGRKSEILLRGLYTPEQREDLKSIGKKGGIDFAYMEEATDFDWEDFQMIDSRVRGNHMIGPDGKPWTQLGMGCNPAGSSHWIWVRMILGQMAEYYYSDWMMNPSIDREAYTKKLEAMTGVLSQRMYYGIWSDGIGMVLDKWVDRPGQNVSTNVTEMADYRPGAGDVFWVWDDGYTGSIDPKTGLFTAGSQPAVCLWVQKRKTGRFVVFNESYKVKKVTRDHIDHCIAVSREHGWPLPRRVIYDGASPDVGAEMRRKKLSAVGVRAPIESGLNILRTRIAPDENGVRLLLAHPRCRMLRYEINGYVYNNAGIPIDALNHGVDGLRYLVWHDEFGGMGTADVAGYGVDDGKMQEISMLYEQVNASVLDKVREAMQRSHDRITAE